MPVLRVALQMVLGIALTLGLQLLLRAWATPAQRARGWNVATWGSALQWFGPASMLGFCVVHGTLTFGGVIRSLLRGAVWTALLALFVQLIDVGFVGRYGTTKEKRETIGAEEERKPQRPRTPSSPGDSSHPKKPGVRAR